VNSLAQIRLLNFRNYDRLDLEWGSHVNMIVGRNGSGKTNLLEAVFLVASGQVLRAAKDAEAIRHGESQALVTGISAENSAETKITLRAGHRKQVMVNGASLARASDLLGRMPAVTFLPEDLDLVRGSPDHRRHFLDLALSQVFPAYLNHLANYKRALQHRNALLKRAQDEPVGEDEFEIWEGELDAHGSALRSLRMQFIEECAPIASGLNQKLAGGDGLEMAYEVCPPPASRSLEIARGYTLSGPHRDDLDLKRQGFSLRSYGSQGQQRTAAIALKLSELEFVASKLEIRPMLLLDDVFSELDQIRRSNLITTGLNMAGQIFITCTEPEQGGELAREAKIYRVSQGEVTEEP